MPEHGVDLAAAYPMLVAKAWHSPAFKAKFLANPAEAVREVGVDMPAGITLTVVENTDKVNYFVLPMAPRRELLDQFKAKLLANPAATLAELGGDMPAGVTLTVLENTDKVNYFVLPMAPGPSE